MKLTIFALVLAFIGSNCALAQGSYYTDDSPSVVQYRVETEVVFGHGAVLTDGQEGVKELWMDVYHPLEETAGPRPAIILTYGGSFHRGNPRIPYVGIGAQTTTMSQYAQRFASEGYVCFTITYRVAPDNPVIAPYEGFTEDDLDVEFFKSQAAITQANIIRRQMGLEDVTQETVVPIMKNAVIAAAEDLRKAIRYVKAESDTFGVDPERIGLLGFSAGAVTTVNVAYGMKEDVAAIVVNSGYPSVFDMDRLLTDKTEVPPALFHLAQFDYEVVEMELVPLFGKLDEIGAQYILSWVPSHGHFYPSGASTLTSKGERLSVFQGALSFFAEHLRN